MNLGKLILAALVVGVVWNGWDFVVHGQILQSQYAGLEALFRKDAPMQWLVIGDFVAALVFVWVYDRVYGSFGGGWKGGATYGFYAGVLASFPTWIFMNLLIVGFPYSLAWIWTIVGILAGVIGGAVAGMVYKK
jgi:hypothetical protein